MLETPVLEISPSFIFLEKTTIAALESPNTLLPFSEEFSSSDSDGLMSGLFTIPFLLTSTAVQSPHISQIAITPLVMPSIILPLDSSFNFFLPHASITPQTYVSLESTSITYPDLLPEGPSDIVLKTTVLPTSSPLQVSALFQTMLMSTSEYMELTPTSQLVKLTPTFTHIASLIQSPSGLILPNIEDLSTHSMQPVVETPFVLPTKVDEVPQCQRFI